MRQKWWIFGAIVGAVLSFLGLHYLVNRICPGSGKVDHLCPEPELALSWPLLLFFTFMFLGLIAGTVPISAFLNHRFSKPDWLERDKIRLVRQGVWVGLFGVLLAYLQLVRALNWTIAAVLAGVFVFIETFFLTRA
jgi:hypothetical protein